MGDGRGIASAAPGDAHQRGARGAAGPRLEPTSPRVDEHEARFAALLRAWWRDEHPPWTALDWWDTTLREEVRALLWLPAGPRLACALAAVEGGDTCTDPHAAQAWPGLPTPGHHRGWPCACMVVLAAAWEACAAWCAAGAAVALVDAAGATEVSLDLQPSGRRVVDPAREELAPALRVTPNSMGNRIDAARELVAHPRLVELVASAAISAWAARLVVLEVADLTEDDRRAVVDRVCTRIVQRLASGRRAWTSAEVGRLARLTRRRICPDSDRPVRERAYERRRVRVYPDKNGMAVLVADLAQTDAERIQRRIAAVAHGLKDPSDSRSCDQVRADVFVDLLLGAAASAPRGTQAGDAAALTCTSRSGVPADHGGGNPGSCASAAAWAAAPGVTSNWQPDIQVVVPLATLLGLSTDPAEVPGLGPIPAEVARALAADGRWRAWVTDAAGATVATGSQGYIPSAGLARLVRAREPFCRMPGCRQAAQRCDLDHAVPYPVGATTVANLGPLCRRHHVMKTHGAWQLQPEGCSTCPDDLEWDGAFPSDGDDPLARDAGTRYEPDPLPGAEPHRHQGLEPGSGWRWRTPAGFTITDAPAAVLS